MTDSKIFGFYLCLCIDAYLCKIFTTPAYLPSNINVLYYNLRRAKRLVTLHNIIVIMDYLWVKNIKELLEMEIPNNCKYPTLPYIEQYWYDLEWFLALYTTKRQLLFGF